MLTNFFPQNPREQKTINSVAVASNGDLYYTESTSDVEINQFFLNLLANPNGRLIHYDRKNKKTNVLLDRLLFANGVALSPDEEFVVVSDFGRNRLMKYYIAGKRADTYHVFADALPGCPDNLTPDDKGLWVALPWASDRDNMIYFQKLAQYPTIRKFFSRVVYLSSYMFKRLFVYTQIEQFKTLAMKVDSFETYGFLFSNNRATILRLNWNGKVIASYHSFDGSFYTHVLDKNDGKLYLGSFTHDYIARVDRKNHD